MSQSAEIGRRALLLAAGSGLMVGTCTGLATQTELAGDMLDWWTGAGEAAVGGPFQLISDAGVATSDRDFRGRAMIVVFGYAHDADQTPALLQLIIAARAKGAGSSDRIATIFVTLDPARDRPAILRNYLAKYDNSIVGLTGAEADIFAIANAYRLPLVRTLAANGQPSGAVAFEPLIYFMNRRGKYVTHLSLSDGVDRVANVIRHML